MISVLLCVLHSMTVSAAPELPTVEFSGVVVSEMTGDPVSGARLRLVAAGVEVRSEEDGTFSFGSLEIAADTLVVSHPEHAVARLAVADLGPGTSSIRVRLRPVSSPAGRPALDPSLDALARLDGVSTWNRTDFETFGASVAHPLDFLVFSGLFEDVPGRSGGARCPRFTGAPDCARIWLDLTPTTVIDTGAVPLSELRGFILVPPGVIAPALGLTTGDHTGAVVVIAGAGAP